MHNSITLSGIDILFSIFHLLTADKKRNRRMEVNRKKQRGKEERLRERGERRKEEGEWKQENGVRKLE
jgi:hypothetical protein